MLGTTEHLPRILDGVQPDEVIIAIPSAPGTLRQQVVTACRERGIPVRTLPTTFELLSGGVNLMRQVREVRVEDVLGRDPVRVEIDRVGAYLRGRLVLVTGAGGSIGAELCRQIARVGAKQLVLVEHSENALFEIRRELEEERHFARAAAVLADCKDATRMREVFAEHRPVGRLPRRRLQARAADGGEPRRGGAEQRRGHAHRRRRRGRGGRRALRARLDRQGGEPGDRHGRVQGARRVGGRGGAAPLARARATRRSGSATCSARRARSSRSSAARSRTGGPVTVTDETMTRYFMTIPEAVQLIIRSGELATGGEVFVLEMGEPVKIIDLARNMIRLAGLEPDVDIAIEIVGPPAGREDPRGALQPGRAAAAHAGREDRVRGAARRSTPSGSRAPSRGSRSSCTPATPPPWPAAVAELSVERALAVQGG